MGATIRTTWMNRRSSRFHTLSASKRRKIIGKVLFVLLSTVAVAIMLFVAWIYTHN